MNIIVAKEIKTWNRGLGEQQGRDRLPQDPTLFI